VKLKNEQNTTLGDSTSNDTLSHPGLVDEGKYKCELIHNSTGKRCEETFARNVELQKHKATVHDPLTVLWPNSFNMER